MSIEPASDLILDWRYNPARFVYDNFNVDPDAWQIEALQSLSDPTCKRISLQACAGPGKSAVLAWAGLWFLACWGDKYEHPKGAAMSVTRENLRDNLWAEFSKWQSRSDYLKGAFKWTGERLSSVEHPETWFLSARSFPKTANSEEQGRTLSGLHSKYIMYLIDESGDINPSVLRSAEQGIGGHDQQFAKIVQAGNPTSETGMLHAAATTLAHLWKIIRITGDPDDPRRSPRIDIENARTQIETYGRDNPWVMAYILGQFPPGGINTLLAVNEVDEAMGRRVKHDDYAYSQKRLGIDVARFGDDRTTIFPRQGLVSFRPAIMRNANTSDISARVAAAKRKWNSELELVDGTGGYGAGVIDQLRIGGHSPLEIHFSGKAIDARYLNKRAEMWFEMADWIKRGGSLPKDGDLKRELTAPTYTFNKGKFQLEDKDQIKKRLGFSPDLADALALTFALPEAEGIHNVEGAPIARRATMKHEYDPLDESRIG